MGVSASTLSPQDVGQAAVTLAGNPGQLVTLWPPANAALQGWAKLLTCFITYVTALGSTPTLTFQVTDASGNIHWKKTAAAFAASLTNTLQLGGGAQDSTGTPQTQQLALPVDLMVPAGGKVQVQISGGLATDTLAHSTVISF
jgi:hypothetical protein